VRLSPIRMSATIWLIERAPDDRRWVWRSRWNGNWQEKTCPSATLSTTNLTCPDLDSNAGRRGWKLATNLLSYGTTYHKFVTLTLSFLLGKNLLRLRLCLLSPSFWFLAWLSLRPWRCCSEKSADFHQTTRHYIAEDRTLHNQSCPNYCFCIIFLDYSHTVLHCCKDCDCWFLIKLHTLYRMLPEIPTFLSVDPVWRYRYSYHLSPFQISNACLYRFTSNRHQTESLI
jgi:hypothetical protein